MLIVTVLVSLIAIVIIIIDLEEKDNIVACISSPTALMKEQK